MHIMRPHVAQRPSSVAEVCDLGGAEVTRRAHIARRARPRSQTSATVGYCTARRHGISLLEVLISIFVMTVGLLGLAALIPVGRFEVLETVKLDRGATLGKQAYREVLLRGMLNENAWVAYDGTTKEYVYWPAYIAGLNSQQFDRMYASPFVLDPQMFGDPRNRDYVFGNANGVPSPATFPYNVGQDASDSGLSNVPQFPRLSLLELVPIDPASSPRVNPLSLPNNSPLRDKDSALADYIFRGRDDLSFVIAGDQDARPIQQYAISSAADSQQFARQDVSARLNATTVGDYSWLVMISPSLSDVYVPPPVNDYVAGRIRTVTASVVVFHKRPVALLAPDPNGTEAPAERTVAITFGGSGIGGGSAHLSSKNPAYLRELRPNQWILVTGKLNTTTWSAQPPEPPVVAKWYRIVSVDDGSGLENPPAGENPHRDVTLDGPDWEANRFMPLGNGPEGPMTMASIFDGVIAVYDRTVTLQSN